MSNKKTRIVSSVQEDNQVKKNRGRGATNGQPTPKQRSDGREGRQRDAKRKEEERSRVESRDSVSSVSRQTRDDS